MTERLQPHSLEAETTLLGAMMLDGSVAEHALATVTAEDFYAHVHGAIFAAIAKLHDANQPTDFLAVATALGPAKLKSCGGASYLRSLYDTVQTASSAAYYAQLIAEKATLRRMIAAAGAIAESAYEGEADVAGAIATAEAALRSAVMRTAQADIGESLDVAGARIYRQLIDGSSSRPGLSSPWPSFDRATGLTFGGEMVVWAAAPGVGKSIAVAQLAMHVAQRHGAVAFFALEMGTAGTMRRLLARAAGIASRRIRLGDLRGDEHERFAAAYETVRTVPVTLFDRTPRRSVTDVRRCVRRIASDAPLMAVVVDHANFLADATAQGRASKHERLDAVYQGLLEIAGEFDCVMHVVQHFSREGASGEPGLHHLRDGGNLEGHANIVVFPMRRDMAREPEIGEFVIAKNRESELCRLPMRFDGFRQEWIDESAAFAAEGVA